MSVLLVGGSGFIGSELARQLDRQGRAFVIADKVPSRVFPDKYVHLDITDPDAPTSDVSRDCTAIVHLAAEHRDDVRPRSRYDEVNVEGTRNVVGMAQQHGIDRIVFTSTVAVYGFADPETGEAGTINPFNDYGRTKFEAEKILRAWQERAPEVRSLTIIRPTVVFGPGNRGNVFNLLRQIARRHFVMIGDGKNRKSMAYVENVSAFIARSLGFGPGCYLFNYVDKPDYDMNTLVRSVRAILFGKNDVGPRLPAYMGLIIGRVADLLVGITGRSLPISTIRVRKFIAETSFASSAHDVPGFIAPVSLDAALKRTLDAEFLNPDSDRVIHYTE